MGRMSERPPPALRGIRWRPRLDGEVKRVPAEERQAVGVGVHPGLGVHLLALVVRDLRPVVGGCLSDAPEVGGGGGRELSCEADCAISYVASPPAHPWEASGSDPPGGAEQPGWGDRSSPGT